MTANSEDALYRGLSTPTEPLNEPMFFSVAVDFASAATELFLDSFERTLRDGASGIVETIGRLGDGADFEMIWSPALGRCLSAVKKGDESLARQVAVEYLTHACANGATGEWEAKLPSPSIFLWGSCLIPACDYIKVKSSGDSAHVYTTLDGRAAEFRIKRSPGEAALWSSEEAVELPYIPTGYNSAIVFLPKRAINPENYDSFGFPLVPDVTPEQFQHLRAMFDLTQEYLPGYNRWFSRILRRVVIVQTGPQKYLRSGSEEGLCGMVYISDSEDLLSLGEMLVHEATHHYFYLITRLGEVVIHSKEMFYSPFVNNMRSLERILLGYHAFANVYLYYKNCMRLFPDKRDVCLQRMAMTLEDVKYVEKIIKESDKLTPIGQAIAEPLIRELRDE